MPVVEGGRGGALSLLVCLTVAPFDPQGLVLGLLPVSIRMADGVERVLVVFLRPAQVSTLKSELTKVIIAGRAAPRRMQGRRERGKGL